VTRRATLTALAATCAAVLGLLACAGPDPREQEVARSVDFARRALERTRTDVLAAESLRSIAEQGGTLLTYVLANLPGEPGEPAAEAARRPRMAPFQQDGPARPWSVRLRQEPGSGTVVIEGFGADVGHPLRVERVVLDLATPGADRP
jgi:hypothetical protein